MLQLKVFYSVSFPEGESCEVIFTDQNIQSFQELMEVVRGKIECLRFIPNSELRVQYVDDENTLIDLRANDSFMDALRCAVTAPGATFHRLKVNILWQPKSTPEMISKKRQEMRASTTTSIGKNNSAELKDPLKKQLNFENPESPAVFKKEMEATALKDTPVDRMLSKKRAGVEGASKALEHARVQKDNFERELSRAAFHNSGSLSICGKCHFKLGHTRRN